MEEEGLSLQGLHAARQVWRRAVRTRVSLRQQIRQLVYVQPPVVRQVILRQRLELQQNTSISDAPSVTHWQLSEHAMVHYACGECVSPTTAKDLQQLSDAKAKQSLFSASGKCQPASE